LEGARNNVTINAICPGYISTEMLNEIPRNVLDKLRSDIPVGRFGKTEEIARAVLFLAQDETGYITGSTLSVNGGQYLV
jgi:acetoacetyl-CoA reductase